MPKHSKYGMFLDEILNAQFLAEDIYLHSTGEDADKAFKLKQLLNKFNGYLTQTVDQEATEAFKKGYDKGMLTVETTSLDDDAELLFIKKLED